jgi:maltooligosyltrehalose trehalohydrolase
MGDSRPVVAAPRPGAAGARRRGVFGALPDENAFTFKVPAPGDALQLEILSGTSAGLHHPRRAADGTYECRIEGVKPGDRYGYRINGGELRPDPASRFQPDGVHGPSEVVDPNTYTWRDQAWHGIEPSALVVYELHVGTFTPAGTFAAAAERLPSLAELGVTAIELMPVADFAGGRNWGYDGVALFAPSRAYGRPDDLRALIDRAHALGLAVMLDVVYNHLGPEGAYLPQFQPDYLTDRHHTPWGGAVNLDAPGSEVVREFIIDNALHWIREYHVDGLRLDATHALIDESGRHVVEELAAEARRAAAWPIVIHAEDHRNLTSIVEPADRAGWGLDGVWADDFHHAVRVLLAGDAHGYYRDFTGTTEEIVRTIRQGWLFTGQYSAHLHEPRGTDPSAVPMQRFVVCLQNHDQIGNRALGERLHHQIDAAAWRAATALLLTAPMTPLLFMGQEWAASSPFLYFTDLEPELGRKVTEGRRREFKDFPQFADAASRERIPDPQAPATFDACRLQWQERSQPQHRATLALYRALLALRREHPALGGSSRTAGEAWAAGKDSVVVRRTDGGETFWIAVRLRGAGDVRLPDDQQETNLRVQLTTEDPRFALDAQPTRIAGRTVHFARPGAVVLTIS